VGIRRIRGDAVLSVAVSVADSLDGGLLYYTSTYMNNYVQ